MMGEMADWIIDQWEVDGEEIERPVTCKLCGEYPLWWAMTGKEQWRLFDEKDQLHSCK